MYVFSYVCLDCLYTYMLWTLLQAQVFQHFRGMGSRDAWCGYEDHQHPRAMLFLSLRGLARSLQRASESAGSGRCYHVNVR